MHDSNTTTGYHLFLEPTGALRESLAATIERLAQAYDGPVFPPHVTLAGPLDEGEGTIRARVESLARETRPFSVTLTKVAGEDAFFRALYIRIADHPELTRFRERFGASGEYTPHLSLFYGMIDDAQRSMMQQEIEYPQGASFIVDRMHLYRTQGTADSWERVGEFPFN